MSAQTTTATPNGLAKFSLILGIVDVVCLLLTMGGSLIVWLGPDFAGILVIGFALIAIITGVIALKQIKVNNQGGRKAAIGGIVLGALGIIFYIIYVFIIAPAIAKIFQNVEDSILNK
jgi:hypothetical protein